VPVTVWPSATRSPPSTQVFSDPRRSSSGALTRWPAADQPGAGGNVRGTTGPSSSAQTTVTPAGGWVERSMTRALWGRTLGHYRPSKSAGAASVPPRPAGCDGPDCARRRSPARERPGPAHPASTHRTAGGRPPPGCRRPAGPAGRSVLADQGDQLATLGLVEPAWPTRPGSVTEPVDPVGVAAVQPLPHGLGVTAQPGGDLAGPLAVPASDHDTGPQDPVGRRMAAGREPAQGALLVGISRWSGVQQRRHGQWAPYGRIPGWTGTDGAFNYIPNLRNAALVLQPHLLFASLVVCAAGAGLMAASPS
jgi:hypothetical protein